jgi:hypothetical protein
MVSHARVLTAAALAALGGCATAPSSPQSPGVEVDVYQSPLDGPNAMPSGCNELGRTAPQSWTELDRTAPTDPYRTQRAATAAAGGNVLLVLDRVAYPRNDYDCPAAARITDCPPSLGAWFDVVFVSYACSAPGLSELPRERRP